MKRDLHVRDSFVMDENHQLHIDKSRVFTENERRRHELCLQLLDLIKNSVQSFRPSDSLAQMRSLENIISHGSLYDYFIPEDDHVPLNDTKLAPDVSYSTTSSSKRPKVEIDIVVSGGGLKGYFMTGCSHILKHELKKQNISIRRIAGASAGAWVGLFMLCDFSTSNWIETYYLCQERISKTIHETYEEMWPWAQDHLPPNAYEICSGRLFISITEVTWFGLKNHIISEFTSNQDLFEACLASSAIPYLTFPGLIKKYRGMYVLDGGITNNTPVFPELPRRTLVFRLTDIFYPAQLLVSAHDACIEALVVRGAILMSRFLQGEPGDTFAWVEYDKESKDIKISRNDLVGLITSESNTSLNGISFPFQGNSTKLIRRSNIFHKVVNMTYYSLLLGGSIYTLVYYFEYKEVWFMKSIERQYLPYMKQIVLDGSNYLLSEFYKTWKYFPFISSSSRK